MTTELIKKQLLGKDAVYAGDPKLQAKPRKFALLSYDTPDGQYKASWDAFYKDLQAAGVPVVGHVSYFLNLNSLAADALHHRDQAEGDRRDDDRLHRRPDLPELPHEADDAAGLLPRMGDGRHRARRHQRVRAHVRPAAVGARVRARSSSRRGSRSRSRTPTRCTSGGSARRRRPSNNYAIIKGDVELLMDGLQLAGPNLTPQTFRDGAVPRAAATGGTERRSDRSSRTATTATGSGTDYGGLDNAGILYWDPKAVGPDETGHVGTGMYRLVDGGRRYLPGQWPTTPVKLFDPAGTVTIYRRERRSRPELHAEATSPSRSNAPASLRSNVFRLRGGP